MQAYAIVDNTVVLRDHVGDVFTFAPAASGTRPVLRLIGTPRWAKGTRAKDAGILVDLARAAALRIARQRGLII